MRETKSKPIIIVRMFSVDEFQKLLFSRGCHCSIVFD